MEWIEYNKSNGSYEFLDEILSLIRIPMINLKDLSEISTNETARKSKFFLEMIVESLQFQTNPESLIKSPYTKFSPKNSSIPLHFESRRIRLPLCFPYCGEKSWFVVPQPGNYKINCKGANGLKK